MALPDASLILDEIYSQRKSAPLSILSLAEPILNPDPQPPKSLSQSQNGDSSITPSNPQITPSSLTADLAHYKDLFSKLRFSYLEQVTKEKYLRGIVGSPPIHATSADNAALETKLSAMKSELQGKKRRVEAQVAELEALAREIAEKYDGVNLAVVQLETVPGEVEALEAKVVELRRRVGEQEGEMGEESEEPWMNLSLEETERLIEEERVRDEELQRRVGELEREMEAKTRECERAERELVDIEGRRNEITRLVREAQRRKEEGGRDLLEEQGRWYKSSEIVLKGLLGVQG